MLPALLIAQRVYQDGSRADELVTRNQVRNPLFVPRRPGGAALITGYIDTIDIDLTDTSCRLSVNGRDKTGDLVDSSAIHGSGQWKNVRLEQIVRDICKPFGIEVLVQTDTGDAISSSLDDEKAFDAIDRAARAKAILVSSSPAGQLVLTRASETLIETKLVEG